MIGPKIITSCKREGAECVRSVAEIREGGRERERDRGKRGREERDLGREFGGTGRG
jgi:hypothetical protein